MRKYFVLGGSLLAAACSSSTGTSAAGPQQVGFSLASTTGAPTALGVVSAAVGPEVIKVGTDSIVLTKVQIVLRKVRLTQVDSVGRRCEEEHEDRMANDTTSYCQQLKLGPILVDLPLGDTTAKRQFLAKIPLGTYVKAELKIHAPKSPADSAFLRTNPTLDSASVRVEGTYNGRAFVFKSRVESEQEFRLNPPLVVTDTAGTNLTIKVELGGWFLNSTGALIDPSTAAPGTDLNRQIGRNIRRSFRGFHDRDGRGHDDDNDRNRENDRGSDKGGRDG